MSAGIAATPTNFPVLRHLDVSYNQIPGGVPTYLPSSIEQLYLDHNVLTGQVSAVFANSGSSSGTFSNLTCWSLDHNPGLCGLAPVNSRCFDKTGTNISKCCWRVSHCTGQPVAACHAGLNFNAWVLVLALHSRLLAAWQFLSVVHDIAVSSMPCCCLHLQVLTAPHTSH